MEALDVRFLVLHDFDKAGFSIIGTLRRNTARYHFRRPPEIVDLVLRLADVVAEGLSVLPGEQWNWRAPLHVTGHGGRAFGRDNY